MLYVSFWSIVLSNLPSGAFTKRVLSNAEAADLVSTARREEKLAGVAARDLFAPYAKRNRDLHAEICEALGQRGIELSLEDFSSGDFCNPITLARVSHDSSMLVVDCNFELDSEAMAYWTGRSRDLLRISTDTLQCYLLEATPR
jgi:hypothetical protein